MCTCITLFMIHVHKHQEFEFLGLLGRKISFAVVMGNRLNLRLSFHFISRKNAFTYNQESLVTT